MENASLEQLMEKPEVSQVLEWTFFYDAQSKEDGTPYNTTFFESIGGVPYSLWKKGEISAKDLIQRVVTGLSEWQKILETELDHFAEKDDPRTAIQREAIIAIITTIEMGKIATPIELEKASEHPILEDNKREALVREMDVHQTRLYGESPIESIEEVHGTLTLMQSDFEEGKKYLSKEEQMTYREIYADLVKKLSEKYPDVSFQENIDTSTLSSQVESRDMKRAETIMLPREVYMKLWGMFISSNDLTQKVVTSGEVTSIFDGDKELKVPLGKKYDMLDLKKVLLLMTHEIGVHYINQQISEKAGFTFRGANNLEKEEGLAMICEGLMQGKTLDEMKRVGYASIFNLVSGLLGQEARQNIVDLRVRIDSHGLTGDISHGRDLRVMRGYPLNSRGAQRKDLSYGRGLLKIIKHLESGEFSLTDFFAGKFSIEDIISGRIDTLIPRDTRTFPLLFPEMLLSMILHGRDGFTHEKFITYLEKKYGRVLRENELSSVKHVTELTKLRTFLDMWKIIEQYVHATPPHQSSAAVG